MRTTTAVIDDIMSSPVVRSKNLTREDVEKIVESYQDSVFSVLLDNGYVRLSEDFSISLVKLKERRYVLRGTSYTNNRSYKLKVLTSREIYNRIEETYDSFIGEGC